MKDLVGFIFSWCARMMSNTIFRSAMWLLLSRLFTAISSTFAYMLLEDRIHCSLICCPLHSLIRKASWCSNTPPMAFWRMYAFSSSRYILIWLYPEKFIHKRHSLETAYVVNYDIRDRERELVFGRSGVQIVKVDADLDLPVLLGDRNDVVYPVKVLFFPDEVRVYEFFNFWFNCLHDLWTESSLLLLDWLRVRINVEVMHGHMWFETRHAHSPKRRRLYTPVWDVLGLLSRRW